MKLPARVKKSIRPSHNKIASQTNPAAAKPRTTPDRCRSSMKIAATSPALVAAIVMATGKFNDARD